MLLTVAKNRLDPSHCFNQFSVIHKSSSGDEIPERDVLSSLFTYLPWNYDTLVGLLPGYFF